MYLVQKIPLEAVNQFLIRSYPVPHWFENEQEHFFVTFLLFLFQFQGDEGILTAEYTGEAHFGGFMTRADDEFKSGRGNNRKDFIDNLIKAGP